MKKHRIPVGWPRPDPCHYRFPLPNVIWEYDLKPTEFAILSYLCYFHSHSHNDEKISAEVIAKAVQWKGNNLYTILPTQQAADAHHQRKLRQLELDAERRRAHQRQEVYDRRHPRASLCALPTPGPAPAT